MNGKLSASRETFLKSSFYEQLVQHVFVSEVLQETWYRHRQTAEVLRSEVDASGYDLVFECNGVLRHIQLKTSLAGAATSYQKVNSVLAGKPSGCVVWLLRHEDPESCRMRLKYRFFGGPAGQPLPSLTEFPLARHTKGDAQGVKGIRPRIRRAPRGRFIPVASTGELLMHLFGLRQAPDS